jgi:hypothetical protein
MERIRTTAGPLSYCNATGQSCQSFLYTRIAIVAPGWGTVTDQGPSSAVLRQDGLGTTPEVGPGSVRVREHLGPGTRNAGPACCRRALRRSEGDRWRDGK